MTHGPLFACALLAVLSRAAFAGPIPTPHVRSTDSRLAALVALGAERAPALQALITRLNQSNVLVYVEYGILQSGLSGRLAFVGASGGWRYLRVQIECRQNRENQTVALGHELQHAVEIADAGVGDEPSVQRLYSAIGFAIDDSEQRFESRAAQQAGVQIRRELHAPAAIAGN